MEPATLKSVRPVELLDRPLSISMTVLIAIVLVDPSDKILHAKVPVFCLIFSLWFLIKLQTGLRLRGMNTLLFALLIAVVIPSISLVGGLVESKIDDPLTGLAFLKAYLFFSLLIVVTDRAITLERPAPLSGIVAFLTIAVFAVAMLAPRNRGHGGQRGTILRVAGGGGQNRRRNETVSRAMLAPPGLIAILEDARSAIHLSEASIFWRKGPACRAWKTASGPGPAAALGSSVRSLRISIPSSQST
jgi:hypothetical protein